MRKALGNRLLGPNRPDVFVGVDAPDFNLDLECRLRAAGVPTVHFVCPSFWAWRPEKVLKLKAAADHVLCLFPFEPALLENYGIASTFVGHPLAQMIPLEPNTAAARAELGLPADAPVVAVLPGSREDEVKYLADRFFAAAAIMQQQPDLHVVVPAMPALKFAIENAARRAGLRDRLTIVQGQSHRVLEACDATLIASGTATLEAALYKKPMVIAYNMHALSWWMMQRKRLQPWVGLPNILLGEGVVPEWLQEQATPAQLAQSTLAWLAPSANKTMLQERFMALHQQLRQDTLGLVTHAIEKVVRG
jgi:lipid-A-disaccharide synthase